MNFRYKAMQRMREPDELDAPMVLASPRGWIAVMVVLIVMTGAVVWTFVGKLPVSVTASGLLTRPAGTASVQSPYSGVIGPLLANSTDKVETGQVVARIVTASGRSREILSPFAGNVVSVAVSEGEVVAPGTTVVTVERTDAPDDRMVAMLFVPAKRATELTPGNSVDLSVSTAPSSQFGLLRGQITSVGPYPLTSGALAGLVGGPLAAQSYSASGAARLVIVDLIRDADTKSGYAWSSKSGAPFRLRTQIAVSGTISIGSQTPFNLMFGR